MIASRVEPQLRGPSAGRPDPKRVELIAATDLGWVALGEGFTTRDLIAIWETGLPGPDPQAQITQALSEQRQPVYAGNLEAPF